MFQTPSTVEEARLCVLALTSFSMSGFSLDMDKPAMAESTLVKGTDMVYRVYLIRLEMEKGSRWDGGIYSQMNQEMNGRSGDGRREEGKKRGQAGDQGCVRGGAEFHRCHGCHVTWMFVSYKQGSTLFLLYFFGFTILLYTFLKRYYLYKLFE